MPIIRSATPPKHSTPTTSRGNSDEMVVRRLYAGIIDENYTFFEDKFHNENDLEEVAYRLRDFQYRAIIVNNLISSIPKHNSYFDWNVGSILQHFDLETILLGLRSLKNPESVHNSIGLAWVLGEFRSNSPEITGYLHSVVRNTTNPEAWWRAAFSIERVGGGQAVSMLKTSLRSKKVESLSYYLNNLHDKRSLIGVLLHCTTDNTEKTVYPKVKSLFLNSTSTTDVIINCCWLIGRLRLIDAEISKRLLEMLKTQDYELKYYLYFAIQQNAPESLRKSLEDSLLDSDPLIRKLTIRALVSIGKGASAEKFRKMLPFERHPRVVSELTEAIYTLKNPLRKEKHDLLLKSSSIENGMITDRTNGWYVNPSIYEKFSESEDPDNLCFSVLMDHLKGHEIENPIDLGSGTGKIFLQIANLLPFRGRLFGVDSSRLMCDHLRNTIRCNGLYTINTGVLHGKIADLASLIPVRSSLIVSSFAFPSCFKNRRRTAKELRAVHDTLSDDGLFVTIGWDETFNDELSEMWYRFVPDRLKTADFDDWRSKRSRCFKTPRNCGLHWLTSGLKVPLQFKSLSNAAQTMGHLFGRDAAEYVIRNNKTEWSISLGITLNTKEDLSKIINR